MITDRVPRAFDHLMYGGADLDAVMSTFESRAGVAAQYGGRHDVGGTHNALVALGGDRYLELIGPDPEAEEEVGFAGLLGSLPEPRNIMWAIAVPDLDTAIESAKARGYEPGEIMPLSRDAPDGTRLEWRVCIGGDVMFGVVPFLIEWGSCPHPAQSAPTGCTLQRFSAEHPDPEETQHALRALGIDMEVTPGSRPVLTARIETPNGTVTLQ